MGYFFESAGLMPDVYMREVDVPGPIPGVSTSIAAFIGPAKFGLVGEAVRLNNWSQFTKHFGDYVTTSKVYVTHAVQGFFANGGSSCYFIRVGNATRGECNIRSRENANKFTLKVKAVEEGPTKFAAVIKARSLCSTFAAKPLPVTLSGVANDKLSVTITDAEASNFCKDDVVLIEQKNNKPSIRAEIIDIKTDAAAKTGTVYFKEAVTDADMANSPTIRLNDLIHENKVRVLSIDGISVGSYLTLTQDETETCVVDSVSGNFVRFLNPVSANIVLDGKKPVRVVSQEFDLIVADKKNTAVPIESFIGLSMNQDHPNYFKNISSNNITVEDFISPPCTFAPPDNLPNAGTYPIPDGNKENYDNITKTNYLDAIKKLYSIEDVNILCIPDCAALDGVDWKNGYPANGLTEMKAVQDEMINHCKSMMDRFAILDPPMGADKDAVKKFRNSLSVSEGGSYAAMYYPWIVVSDPKGKGTLSIPPSGHVAGVYARTDSKYGVHQAPAGELAGISSAIAVVTDLSRGDHGELNDEGINVIRTLSGLGTVIWGARTLVQKNNTQWRYINVRRLMMYIEESVKEATHYAVFKASNKMLWETIKRQVTGFLTRVWQSGALVGDTPDKAFRVKIDEELNPPEVRALGQLIIEVKVYPTTPAEFIVFFITQQPGGATIKE